MPDHNPTTEILPIDHNLTRRTFAQIWYGIDQLKQSLVNAADYSATIGPPDGATAQRITSAITDLITATAEAATKLRHHQARRKAATTPQQKNPHHTTRPRTPRPKTANAPRLPGLKPDNTRWDQT